MQLGIEVRSGQARGHTSLWNVTMGPAALGGGRLVAPPANYPYEELGVITRWAWLEEAIGWKGGRRRDRSRDGGQRIQRSWKHLESRSILHPRRFISLCVL